ncbi:hypothetical protein [Snuella sedimenti]|uniref:Uncharacterized protein n=1 Tax=Snuella sedimenti TaxID=2798802 RepID=A0A8J7LR32_9FLAO|nr:hypothetical protein [Snuella sedimenti]MBJ6366750.1 hypothetical protein [Snuella sedimenti]
MTIKRLSILCLFFIILSCKKTTDNNQASAEIEIIDEEITESEISKLNYTEFTLDSKTQTAIKSWTEYYQLQDHITNIKKGDLSFFNDNESIESFLKKFKETIPAKVDTPAILARITAFETKLYKLQSLSNLNTTKKPELLKTIKEFLEAFSNLNLQMNKKLEIDSHNIQKP